MDETDKIYQKMLVDQTTHFNEVVCRLKDILCVVSDKELAEKLSMSPNAFHNRKKTASVPYPQIVKMTYEQNVNIDWLINGEGPKYKGKDLKNEPPRSDLNPSDPPSQNDNLIVIEHQDIIRRFKDPEKAKEFNKFLVEIEGDDPEGYDELYKEARAIAKTIKRLRDKKNIPETGNGIAINRD